MQKIILDRFPCNVTFPDERYDHQGEKLYLEGARVILTENSLLIATDGPEAARIVFFEDFTISDISENPDEESTIYTKSGKMVVFNVDDSCGCGSRLRGWNPYKTLKRLEG